MSAATDLNGRLALHRSFSSRVEQIGAEGTDIIVIDNFLSDPEALVGCAVGSLFKDVSSTYYPGLRAAIPAIYCFALRAFLGDLIERTFALSNSAVAGELAHFSLITTTPHRLKIAQRLPHVDSTDPKQLAVLHYLCSSQYGGTSFYRHRGTRFEYIDAARSADYQSAMVQELESRGAPAPAYICGDSPQFERIASFQPVFNRVLIYRGMNLHSADIGAGQALDADPRRGRLTANAFFFYR